MPLSLARLVSAVTFLLFGNLAAVSIAQDATAWPPPLKGAVKGVVCIEDKSFLKVPANVAELAAKEGSAQFFVAKTPPRVQLVFHDQLGENAATRRLWSSWGDIGLAKDGSVYVGIGDHGDDICGDARCFVYRWDPKAETLTLLTHLAQEGYDEAGRALCWRAIQDPTDRKSVV